MENVATPATTSSSKSVCPSISTPPVPISNAPSILTVLLNVAAPATTTSSKSACPSTSIPAFKSIALANVDTPVTLSWFTLPANVTSPVNVDTPAICNVVALELP